VVRLLITGVDGSLGLNEHFEVLGLYRRHAVNSSTFQSAAWAGDNVPQLLPLAYDWQPNWIIHCGALSTAAWDPPVEAALADAEPRVVTGLAQVAAQCSARLTVLSSDAVFAGPRMFHDEGSTPGSTSLRASQTRTMEQALADSGALVVRTHAYGWSPVVAFAGFAERAFETLSSGGALEADGCRHATPILVTDLADLLLRAYELRLAGLYHLAGAERTSPYRFVMEMAAALGLRIPPERLAALPAPHDRSNGETSLSSKRARRMLEIQTPLLGDGLARFAAQRHNGWRDRTQDLGRTGAAVEMAA